MAAAHKGTRAVSLIQFIQEHGYWALFIGAFFEGEIVLLAAGFLAHRGYLSLPSAAAVALTGTFCADQFFFLLGRLLGSKITRIRPYLATRAEQIGRGIRNHQWKVIFGFRFLYGTRIVVPFLIGAAPYPYERYVGIDAIAAVLWTCLALGIGMLLGEAVSSMLPKVIHYEIGALVAVVALVVAIKVYLWHRRRKKGTPISIPGVEEPADRPKDSRMPVSEPANPGSNERQQ